ncbi:TIGR01456 family HAD hydrolase [Rhinocladiella mackenziei CBS 650.93]|uniref:Rhinocladiella mackenziei CBS 650.93 unplaced genomic scaffold supercont1.1, whole genome shotgun sequence n=1 Tax=Rhinocladiella mackenziei CBS 650.93 TaxID=1442369 RepID=A0A0D2J369_9EURO|nr:TIGR01456 family HAD hydrolase [Rhinocladiella mackenziei CBS 650.93]KIX10111.1 TIGR01456 family HAD hydrolase [Rhinocladiella mackenziei CBS 650.93]
MTHSIDGVLVRSANPIPHASATLQFLQRNSIPFILLTNGGGKHESERVQDLSSKLSVSLDTSMFVQSHTPFAALLHGENSLRHKCIMVVGGEGGRCRAVAEQYGFTNVVTPGDIYAAHPEIWPFSKPFQEDYYADFARPLPRPINPAKPEESLKIDAVFVYNDPRDWGLDLQVILDVMLSHEGILGTYSAKNGDMSLPNNGYLQDGQPTLYFSNPDLLWAADYHLSRLGQGSFRECLDGVWRAVTGGRDRGAELYKKVIGKPFAETYSFAERQLLRHREGIFHTKTNQRPSPVVPPLKRVYMIGDNPESDICGANSYDSPHGVDWVSLLTRTGVYRDRPGHRPTWEPRAIVDDVKAAVHYALKDSNWHQVLE